MIFVIEPFFICLNLPSPNEQSPTKIFLPPRKGRGQGWGSNRSEPSTLLGILLTSQFSPLNLHNSSTCTSRPNRKGFQVEIFSEENRLFLEVDGFLKSGFPGLFPTPVPSPCGEGEIFLWGFVHLENGKLRVRLSFFSRD